MNFDTFPPTSFGRRTVLPTTTRHLFILFGPPLLRCMVVPATTAFAILSTYHKPIERKHLAGESTNGQLYQIGTIIEQGSRSDPFQISIVTFRFIYRHTQIPRQQAGCRS
jgi:hypothetical protein